MFRKAFTIIGLVLVLTFSSAVVAKSSGTLTSSGDGSITKGFIFNR